MPLFDLDEGLYAAASRQMAISGDWITPRLNSHPPQNPAASTVPFFEKPALIYWLAAGSMRLFGITPLAARLPVALAALATTALIWWAGLLWFGRRAGRLAALIYMTSPLTLVDARQLTTDGLLVLWFSIILFSFWACLKAYERGDSPGSLRYAVLCWIAAALAVLTKGAAGIVLPALAIGLYLLLKGLAFHLRAKAGIRFHFLLETRPLSSLAPALRALRLPLGILLLLLIAFPWHYLIWKAGGRDELGHTWVQEYIIRQHIGRFKGLDKVHDLPFPSYFLFFLLGFFPWACFTPAAFRTVGNPEERDARRFLLAWFWTIFLFFSTAAAKLPTYIAPIYPAAALLVGRWLAGEQKESSARSLRRGAFAGFLTGMFLLAAVLIGPKFAPHNAPVSGSVERALQIVAILLTAGCAAALLFFQNSSSAGRTRGVAALTVMLILLAGVGYTEGYAAADHLLGAYQRLSMSAIPDSQKGIPIVYYHIIPRRPSMLFYGGYSPYEHKETPLLPWLRISVPLKNGKADIITSEREWKLQLKEELASSGIPSREIARSGEGVNGWRLLQIQLPVEPGRPSP